MDTYPAKRALDVLAAGTACAVFAPVVVGVTLAVWLEDGGPPLFSQSRVGQGRNPFTLLKFRSMRNAQERRRVR